MGAKTALAGVNPQQNVRKKCLLPYENTIFSSSIRSAARSARSEEVISKLLEGK
jgi:hypothetical protein